MAFGNKNSTPSFALTLPMKVTKQKEIQSILTTVINWKPERTSNMNNL